MLSFVVIIIIITGHVYVSGIFLLLSYSLLHIIILFAIAEHVRRIRMILILLGWLLLLLLLLLFIFHIGTLQHPALYTHL